MRAEDLPHPPTNSLHILPPWLIPIIVIALLLGLLALWLWWRARRRGTKAKDIPVKTRRPSTADDFATATKRIEDQYLKSQAYRDGLHALAAVIRTRLVTHKGLDAEGKTVEEIRHRLDDSKVNDLLLNLRDHQFGKHQPDKGSFRTMFRRARKVFGSGKKRAR